MVICVNQTENALRQAEGAVAQRQQQLATMLQKEEERLVPQSSLAHWTLLFVP